MRIDSRMKEMMQGYSDCYIQDCSLLASVNRLHEVTVCLLSYC